MTSISEPLFPFLNKHFTSLLFMSYYSPSSRFGYYNPYRPHRKGYLIRKKPNSITYRSLSFRELRDMKEQYDLGNPEQPVVDPSLPSSYYETFVYPQSLPDLNSDFIYDNKLFSSLSPYPGSWDSIIGISDTTSRDLSCRYFFYMVVGDGIASFYTCIFVNDMNRVVNFHISFVGLKPGHKVYYIASSQVIAYPADYDFGYSLLPVAGLDSSTSSATAELVSSCRQTFRVYRSTNTTMNIELAFTGDSPQYPFIALPSRMLKNLPE